MVGVVVPPRRAGRPGVEGQAGRHLLGDVGAAGAGCRGHREALPIEGELERALALEPANPALRVRLGTALWRMGDLRGARDHLAGIEPEAAGFSEAQIPLGEILGRRTAPAKRWSSWRRRWLGQALAEYARVPEGDPAQPDAAFGAAMNLVRLERYVEARARLERAAEDFPGQRSRFTHPLARLLAAAPDDGVRDGDRALAIVERLAETEQSLLLGETLAMALAEVGRFGEAATVQRDLIAAAGQAGLRGPADVLSANLRRSAGCRAGSRGPRKSCRRLVQSTGADLVRRAAPAGCRRSPVTTLRPDAYHSSSIPIRM